MQTVILTIHQCTTLMSPNKGETAGCGSRMTGGGWLGIIPVTATAYKYLSWGAHVVRPLVSIIYLVSPPPPPPTHTHLASAWFPPCLVMTRSYLVIELLLMQGVLLTTES